MPLQPHRLLTALGADEVGPTDGDLLARFGAQRDSGAFELLVYRHAPLVLRVCRSALRDRHAAEDAAQAVFLALARQAGAVRGETLPGWLFRVSRRVAVRAARRRPPPVAEVDLDALPVPPTRLAPDPADARLLHDELARLPEAYRAPILLCYFEGLTRTEAAHRLGWPVGTVDGRLARGKERLAIRLARRGIVPALLAAGVEAVPPSFAGAVARAAVAYSTGVTTGLPTAVVSLISQETRRTAMNRLAKGIGAALAVGVVAIGLGTAWGGDPSAPAQPTPAQPPQPAPPVPAPPKAVVGKTFAVAPVTTDLQRRLLRDDNKSLTAFVSVDGRGLFPDDKSLAFDALDQAGLLRELRALRPTAAQKVFLQTYYITQLPGQPRAGKSLVAHALEGIGWRAGFGRASAGDTLAYRDWNDFVAPLREAEGADAREAGVGDDKAKAYPVRTPLSRVLTLGMAVVVDVRPRLDNGVVAGLPDGLNESVRSAVRELRAPRGGKLHVLFNASPVGLSEEAGAKLRRLSLDWAAAEGLEGGTYTVG